MIFLFKQIWLRILNVLFPNICLNCRQESETILCPKCLDKISVNQTFFCAVCKRRLAENKKICHKKTAYLLAPAGSYQDPALKQLIWILKYRRFRPAAKIIAEILNRYLENIGLDWSKFKITSVPLHPHRQRQRGFNQAELIADELAKLRKTTAENYLTRIKDNAPQVKMKNREERKTNMKECFSAIKNAPLKNQSIILVDDVSASGATLESAALVLKKAGAKKIIGLVLTKS